MREIVVKWNPIGALQFEATDARNHRVILDGSPEHGGDEQGFSPKTLLLIALGGCTGMDVISMLRKMRQDVAGYQLEIKGWEQTEHPRKFERIIIEHTIEGYNLNQAMVDKAVKLSHEKYCGVSASLAGSVQIEMVSRLVQKERI